MIPVRAAALGTSLVALALLTGLELGYPDRLPHALQHFCWHQGPIVFALLFLGGLVLFLGLPVAAAPSRTDAPADGGCGCEGDEHRQQGARDDRGLRAMTVLVTGAAGFIGAQLCRRLLARGDRVIGIDNFTPYYSLDLKRRRLDWIGGTEGAGERFRFIEVDFGDHAALDAALAGCDIDRIAHLGAQPGVRYSIENPRAYVHSNLVGHLNLMEVARGRQVAHMVYASSSSVYGQTKSLPFRVEDRADFPVSLYAATKKADELMSETYSHLYRIPQTGLRFFTVYGPWGRPDMAVWMFTEAILADRPIPVFNNGQMMRDFTYIDDIISGVVAALDNPPPDDGLEKAGGSVSPHRLYNIGNNRAEQLGRLIEVLEEACGKTAIRDYKPMQPGDVPATYADISAIQRDLGFAPTTPIEVGIPKWLEWYRGYAGAGS